MIHAFLAYVTTDFGQAKKYVGQVKIIKYLPGMAELVLKLMLEPEATRVLALFTWTATKLTHNYNC